MVLDEFYEEVEVEKASKKFSDRWYDGREDTGGLVLASQSYFSFPLFLD